MGTTLVDVCELLGLELVGVRIEQPAALSLSLLGAAALDYVERGYAIFPLRPREKRPIYPGGFHHASTDADQIVRWWTEHPDANIGLFPMRSGLAVADIDGPEAEAVAAHLGLLSEPTYTVQTSHAGFDRQHRYFAYDGPPLGNLRLALVDGRLCAVDGTKPGLEIKHSAGYVVAPPSLHPDGHRYEVATPDDEPAEFPVSARIAIRDGLRRAPSSSSNSARNADTGPSANGVIAEGQRNAALASLAGGMRKRGATPAAIEAALLADNAQRCQPPLPDKEVRNIAASIGRYPPGPVDRSSEASGDGTDHERAREPRRFSAADLLADPNLLKPPAEVLPYLAWEERITVLAGSWKSGKSTLVSQGVAQAIMVNVRLRRFLGMEVRPGPWLWLALDEPLADLWRRLHTWGLAEPAPIAFYDHQRPSLDRIARDLAEMGATGLVIDSLTNFARGLITDVRQPAEWEALFSDLRAAIKATKTAVIAMHHTPYGGDTPRPADSRQIGASADVIVTLVKPENDATTRKLAAIGRGVQYEHQLRYDGSGGYELAARPASVSVQIIEYVRQGHGPGVREVLEAVGGDRDFADRERKALIAQGVIVQETDGQKKRHYLAGAQPQPPQRPLEIGP